MPTLTDYNPTLAPEVETSRVTQTRATSTPGKRTANKTRKKPNTRKLVGGTTTRQRAQIAAEYLARHWPKDVAREGGSRFIARRKREILAGEYPVKYWHRCQQLAHSTALSLPTFATAPTQPAPPYYEPGALNSLAQYKHTTRRYPTPSFGTPLPDPAPGWAGSVQGTVWRDEWMAQAEIDYALPQDFDASDPQPLWAKTTILWHVIGDGVGNKIWFGSQIQATLWQQDEADPRDPTTLAGQSRYYVFPYPLPADAPPAYDRSMQRTFQHDTLLKPSPRAGTFEDCDRATLRIAPCPPMGKYRFGNSSAAADLDIDAELYQAKQQDPTQGSAPSVFEGFWQIFAGGQDVMNPEFPDLRIYVWLGNDLTGAIWPLTEIYQLPLAIESEDTRKVFSFGAPVTLEQPRHIFAHGRAYKLEASPGDFEKASEETQQALNFVHNGLCWAHWWLDCHGWQARAGRMTQEKFNVRYVQPLRCRAEPEEEKEAPLKKPRRTRKPKPPPRPTRLANPLTKSRLRRPRTTHPLSAASASGTLKQLISYSQRAGTTRAGPPGLPNRRATVPQQAHVTELAEHARRYPDSASSATHTIQQYNAAAAQQPAGGKNSISMQHVALDLNGDLRSGQTETISFTRSPVSLRSL